MNSNIYKFISSTNPVLLFMAAVLFIVITATEIYQDLFPKRYEPPKVKILNSENEAAPEIKVVHTVEFYKKIKDVLIFQVISDVIDTSLVHESGSSMALRIGSPDYNRGNVVNFMFSREGESRRMLFERDVLIHQVSETMPVTEGYFKLDMNIYLASTEDSNNDGYLNQDDRADLFVSAYDGKEFSEVLKNVESYTLIGDNSLLIKHGSEPKFSFYVYDVAQMKLNPVDTKITLTK